MKKNGIKNSKGFTLVEIAIVLIVIGLIVVGVLKGSVLIESAKYKSLLKSVTDYQEMVGKFQEKYQALPGDITKSNIGRLLNNSLTNTGGSGNGKIGLSKEETNVWVHLQAAGYLSTDISSGNPKHAFSGNVKIYWDSNVKGERGNWLVLENLPVGIAKRLDRDMDDGKPFTGSVRKKSNACTSGGEYNVNTTDLCQLFIAL
jgi:prepilin-type N-terminal cleavage/methylation domain-containing protein